MRRLAWAEGRSPRSPPIRVVARGRAGRARSRREGGRTRETTRLLAVAVAGGLLTLPIAVWLDLRDLSARLIRLQADETGRIIDVMRDFSRPGRSWSAFKTPTARP